MGTPLVSAAFGRHGLSLIVAIIALHSGVFLTLTAVLLKITSRAPGGIRVILQNTAANLVKNPIIMSIVVGLIWRLTALELPSPLHNLLTLLGNAAAPLALFCLGASLPTAGRLSLTPEVALAAIIKLIVLPSAVGAVAWTIGLPDLPWRVAVLTAAVPTGANAILLARRANQFSESSAHTVVLATAVSVLTITALLSWLH